jgi:hypothetical protein
MLQGPSELKTESVVLCAALSCVRRDAARQQELSSEGHEGSCVLCVGSSELKTERVLLSNERTRVRARGARDTGGRERLMQQRECQRVVDSRRAVFCALIE